MFHQNMFTWFINLDDNLWCAGVRNTQSLNSVLKCYLELVSLIWLNEAGKIVLLRPTTGPSLYQLLFLKLIFK